MIEVKLLQSTHNPIDVIAIAAGNCYGKDNASSKRVKNCIRNKHLSVLEHASVTFKISGISRACSHQLVRSRLASFCQQSQRYCKIDVSNEDWFVKPNSIDSKGFVEQIQSAGKLYQELLEEGVKTEDARYVLPECCKTEIVMTMNARELNHTFRMRLDKSAQWEIRNLFQTIQEVLQKDMKNPQWSTLITLMQENGFEE